MNWRKYNITDDEVREIYTKGMRDWKEDECDRYESFVLDDIIGEEKGLRIGPKRKIEVNCGGAGYVYAIEIEGGRTLITGFTPSQRDNSDEGTDHYFLVEYDKEVFYTDSLMNPDMNLFYSHPARVNGYEIHAVEEEI